MIQTTEHKPVIVHMHLFKNAGTTFDSFLNSNFRSGFVDHRNDIDFKKVGGLLNYLSEHDSLDAISSHSLNQTSIEYARAHGIKLFSVSFVRHPIERVSSVYRFEKQQDAKTPGAIAAKKYNEVDYIKWRINERPQVIANYQSRCFGADNSFGELMKKVNTFQYVGVVDKFNESLANFVKLAQEANIELSVTETSPKNVLDSRNVGVHEKCQELSKRIGDELFEELYTINDLDIMLYDFLSCVQPRVHSQSK